MRLAFAPLAVLVAVATAPPTVAALLTSPRPREVRVADDAEFAAAVRAARPGTTLLLAAGDYRGGRTLEGLAGTAERPIVIRGADRAAPPRPATA